MTLKLIYWRTGIAYYSLGVLGTLCWIGKIFGYIT